MVIAPKRRKIAYICVVYFAISFIVMIYIIYTGVKPTPRPHVWRNLFSNISQDRWLRLQKKFSGHNLELLWNGELQGNDMKTLTYRCDSFCGGLGDRLRGIISSYFLSLVLRRKFMIYMRYPCEITHMLIPNMYNWTHQKLKTNSYRSKKVIRAIDNTEILHELNGSSFVDEWIKYDDIIIFTNLDLLTVLFGNIALRNSAIIMMFLQHMLPEESNFQNLFSLLFEVLFKPTEEIIDLMGPIVERITTYNESLLCLHIRVGKNPTNPNDQLLLDRDSIADDMIAFVEENIAPKQQRLLILVASDSNESISKVWQHFPNQSIMIPGPIVHLDRPLSMNNMNEGCLTVVATFYILGECHISILTNSGFSALANRRRIDPYANLYKYDFKQKRIERCENTVLPSSWDPEYSVGFVLFCPVVENFTMREL